MTASTSRSARWYLGLAAVVAVVMAGIVGAAVGGTDGADGTTMDLLGGVSFPVTPASMAAFGMATAAGVLAALFGLVSLASRYDVDAVE